MESLNIARGATATPRTAPPPCTVTLPTQLHPNPRLLHHRNTTNKTKPRHVSCRGAIDRRDVLLGIGCAAAAAGMAATNTNTSLAAPIQAPDLGECHEAVDVPPTAPEIPNCCPTYVPGRTVTVDFAPPPPYSPLRVRPAAHLVDRAYLAKYERAVSLMKALPDDDPRSFAQQWRVHCAYCDGAYDQVGFPGLEIQIHSCWLFFPWHRMYLYFHERILGKLIGDDTFALPFWNWDAPAGMSFPAIYANRSSPLYDPRRNQAHLPPFPLDLDYSGTDTTLPKDQLIDQNLKIIHVMNMVYFIFQMISGARKAELFIGQPYRAGDEPDPGAGSIELVPHNPVHQWTGDPRQPNGEDMGIFYSAARDPVFFAHHGNVDRMWQIRRALLFPGATDIPDPDWLDAEFLFYDEDARLVRVRVRDTLDAAALRFAYQDVGPLPWLDARPAKGSAGTPAPATGGAFPAALSTTVRVAVARPRTSRSRKEKEEEEEVLVVEGIEVPDHSAYVKFDVFVNAPEDGGAATAAAGTCAGSFAMSPHGVHRGGGREGSTARKTVARFGICDLLDDIGADGDETVIVSIVPRCGCDSVTVAGVSIGYVK
uniref:Tyrosinase copper-binding domain-containing protein n=1 Tax=Leersia perrieri TaxID=77586 RepID=A0A0D9W9R3_9ORYZ